MINVPIYGWHLMYKITDPIEILNSKYQPLTFKMLEDGVIKWKASEEGLEKTISYSLNKSDYQTITSSVDGVDILVKAGDIVSFKGNNTNYASSNTVYSGFECSAKFNVYGNILSLITSTGYSNTSISASDYTFVRLFLGTAVVNASKLYLSLANYSYMYSYMFNECSLLTNVPELPATILGTYCYYCLFRNCILITTTPVLPALTLTECCYRGMFLGCTNLTNISIISALTLGLLSCLNMFRNCTSLVTVPNYVTSSTTLELECYNAMFYGCSSLILPPPLPCTTIPLGAYVNMFKECSSLLSCPNLPALEVPESAYRYMFLNCTSLTTVPTLPATTIHYCSYQHMFNGCTSLVNAPEIEVINCGIVGNYENGDNYSMGYMFANCTNLRTPPSAIKATKLATGSCYYMFQNCSSLLSAPELRTTDMGSGCYDSMFLNCTSLTTAPALPVTTLTNSCYNSMFRGCTNLVTAPDLPAETLVSQCYNYMFYGCSKINYINAQFLTTPSTSYTNSWVSGVANNGTFKQNVNATWTTRGIHGIPTNWNLYNPYEVTIDYTLTNSPQDGETWHSSDIPIYNIIITNTGEAALNNLSVISERFGINETVSSLAIGASKTYSNKTTNIIELDILNGYISSDFELSISNNNISYDNWNDVEYPIEELNGHLTFYCDINYSGENNHLAQVTNDGNLTISNIEMLCIESGDTWDIGTLTPGEEHSEIFTYTVAPGDSLTISGSGESPDPDEPDVPISPGEDWNYS